MIINILEIITNNNLYVIFVTLPEYTNKTMLSQNYPT